MTAINKCIKLKSYCAWMRVYTYIHVIMTVDLEL